MSANPRPFVLRSGVYDNEPATFGDLTAVARYMTESHIRPSRTSPPIAADVGEFELVIDKTALRIYTKIDNTLRYVQLV